jgi:zinc transport system ATP-binding protein
MNGNFTVAPMEFKGVTFSYDATPAVEDISLTVEKGEFVALIGPNGSGKTTLARLGMGLQRPQKGSVLLFGTNVQRFNQWHRIGYVPQRANAFSMRFPARVGEVVSMGEYRGFNPRALFKRRISCAAEQALHTVGMWDYRDRLISDLSWGQQQRVLIGRALVHNPELLVLDEPTSGVDMPGQEEFYSLLRHLRKEHGTTILLISHDIGVVMHDATRIACINCCLLAYSHPDDLTEEVITRVYGRTPDVVIH